jgi:hypothetical protein
MPVVNILKASDHDGKDGKDEEDNESDDQSWDLLLPHVEQSTML